MVFLVLLQQPAFAYCVHSDQFFISDCGCVKTVESQCPFCQEENPDDPCDDCAEKIKLDVDELVWFDVVLDAPTVVCVPVVDGVAGSISFPSALEFVQPPIRPPPPPRGVSLLLLHSVFRI